MSNKLPLLKALRTLAGRIEPINLIAATEQQGITLQSFVLVFFFRFS
jgi:hypothetical protein